MSFVYPRYTYEDYERWQGDWELIGGFPFAMAPSPYGKHQKLMGKLLRLFLEALEGCEECELYPELDWIIDRSNVLRPDLAIYCEEIETYPKTTPKLIVEVISDSTAQKDEEIKFEVYQDEGVGYYILAYPDFQKVRIFHLVDNKYQKVYEGDGEFSFDLCDMKLDFKRAF